MIHRTLLLLLSILLVAGVQAGEVKREVIPRRTGDTHWRRDNATLDHSDMEHLARQTGYIGGRKRSDYDEGRAKIKGDKDFRMKHLQENGLKLLDAVDDRETGMQATLVQDVSDGRVYAIFRGTEFDVTHSWAGAKDAWADVGAIGKNQYDANKATFDKWAADHKDNLYVTGHSLGGANAQRFIVDNPSAVTEAVLFNPPGIDRETAGQIGDSELPKITYYTHPDDAVSEVGGQVHLKGTVIRVSGGQTESGAEGAKIAAEHRADMLQGGEGIEMEEVDFDTWQEDRGAEWGIDTFQKYSGMQSDLTGVGGPVGGLIPEDEDAEEISDDVLGAAMTASGAAGAAQAMTQGPPDLPKGEITDEEWGEIEDVFGGVESENEPDSAASGEPGQNEEGHKTVETGDDSQVVPPAGKKSWKDMTAKEKQQALVSGEPGAWQGHLDSVVNATKQQTPNVNDLKNQEAGFGADADAAVGIGGGASALDGMADSLSADSAKKHQSAMDAMGLQSELQQIEIDANASAAQAAQTVSAAGGQAQQIQQQATVDAAAADKAGSWGTVLGDAIEDGITTGAGAVGSAIGAGVANQAVSDVFGSSHQGASSPSSSTSSTPPPSTQHPAADTASTSTTGAGPATTPAQTPPAASPSTPVTTIITPPTTKPTVTSTKPPAQPSKPPPKKPSQTAQNSELKSRCDRIKKERADIQRKMEINNRRLAYMKSSGADPNAIRELINQDVALNKRFIALGTEQGRIGCLQFE